MNTTTESVEPLVSALREELQQYGGMLELLDRQQEQVKARSAGEIFQSISLIQAQALAIKSARNHRETCRQDIAKRCGRAANAGFGELLPLLPADYRPLIQALVEENNQLLTRVRQRARQNHVLLSRSVELMRDLLRSLFPARETSVYNGNGLKAAPALAATRALYNAFG